MEGDGEGLVAIVQGLDASGVTLTVCNRNGQHLDRRRPSRPRIPSNSINMVPLNNNQRQSVETSTDVKKTTTGVQICDPRHASNYKLAHNITLTTLPPEVVSEFPPQRKEPCRNQGNFEIGGHWSGNGSGQRSGHGSRHSSGHIDGHSSGHGSGHGSGHVSRVRHYGGSQTLVGEGTTRRCRSTKDIDPFVHSLRKYPNIAPVRTLSADLIEKLILFTQLKNTQKSSRPTKSMRSLPHRKSSETYVNVKVSKQQQTYTRKQEENKSSATNMHQGCKVRSKNFKLFSPKRESRNIEDIQNKENTIDTSYDYLKAGTTHYVQSEGTQSPDSCRSPNRSRSPENTCRLEPLERPDKPTRVNRPAVPIRDLSISDMTRYIRRTVRQMYYERPVVLQVCPKLKDRYIQHKKICPANNDKSADAIINDVEDQASGPSRPIQSFRGDAVPSTTHSAGVQCSEANCICTTSTQCDCNPDASTNSIDCNCKSQATQSSYCHFRPETSEANVQMSQDQAYFNDRIDEKISEWLKDVPVHSIECPESKNKRGTMIKKLQNTLKNLPDNENFDENVRNEIKNFIDDLPIWNPSKDENEEQNFKQQLSDKLIDRILGIPRKPDRFKDTVEKWAKGINFGEIDMKATIDMFVNKLKSLAADRPACDVKYLIILRKEITKMLEDLPLKLDGDREVILKKMANKLAAEIVTIPRNVHLSDNNNIDVTINNNNYDTNEGKRNMLKEINDIIDNSPIPEDKKDELRRRADNIVENNLPMTSINFEDSQIYMKKALLKNVEDVIDDIDIPEKNQLKASLSSALVRSIDKSYKRLSKDESVLKHTITKDRSADKDTTSGEICDIGEDCPTCQGRSIVDYLKRKISACASKHLDMFLPRCCDHIGDVQSKEEKDVSTVIDKYPIDTMSDDVLEIVKKEITVVVSDLSISEDKKEVLKNKVSHAVSQDFHEALSALKQDISKINNKLSEDIDNAIENLPIDRAVKAHFKNKLKPMLAKDLADIVAGQNLEAPPAEHYMEEKKGVKEIITKDIDKIIESFPIDSINKMNTKNEVKSMLLKTVYKPLSEEVKQKIKQDIEDEIDKMSVSEHDKKDLKSKISQALTKDINKQIAQGDEPDIKTALKKTINNKINNSAISKEKQKVLEHKVEDVLTKHLVRPTIDAKEIIRDKLDDTIDYSLIPKNETKVFKNQLLNTVDSNLKELETHTKSAKHESNAKESILPGIEKTTEDSPTLENTELKMKFKQRKKLNNVKDSIKDGGQDELKNSIRKIDLPPSNIKKNKLKNELTDTEDGNMYYMLNEIDGTKSPYTISKSGSNVSKKKEKTGSAPLTDTEELNVKEGIKRELEKSVKESQIEEDKKSKIKFELLKMTDDIDLKAKDKTEEDTQNTQKYRDKLKETIETWMDNLPVNFDPEIKTEAIDDISSDVLDRKKYLREHPVVTFSDEDEIKNLKYQIFRRFHDIVKPNDMPPILEGTEELHRKIMDIEEQHHSGSRTQDQTAQVRLENTETSTENINNLLKQSIATDMCARKQWLRNLDIVIGRLPTSTHLNGNENFKSKDKWKIYEDIYQTNMLPTQRKLEIETNITQGSKSKKQSIPKHSTRKKNHENPASYLSRIEDMLAFNNTTSKKSPFTSHLKDTDKKDDTSDFAKDIDNNIKTWLEKLPVTLKSNERNKIVEELTRDIVDRQKYLQTFGSKSSQNDYLEYLKIQVHRRLNNLLLTDALKQVIDGTKKLLAVVDNVKVPQMIVQPASNPKSKISDKKTKDKERESTSTSTETKKISLSSKTSNDEESPPPQSKSDKSSIKGIKDVLNKGQKNTSKTKKINKVKDGASESATENDMSNITDFNPSQASTPKKSPITAETEEYMNTLTKAVTTWIEIVPIDLEPEIKTVVINDIANDIIDRQKYLEKHPEATFSSQDELETLKFQVFKRVNKVLEPDFNMTPIMETAEDLFNMIMEDGKGGQRRKKLNDDVANILDKYNIDDKEREALQSSLARELDKLNKIGADPDEILKSMIATIKRLTDMSDEKAEELARELLAKVEVFHGCPMSEERRKLMESQLAEEDDNEGTKPKKRRYGMSFNGLTNFIDSWLSSINTDDDTKDLKKDMAYNLVQQIGEMNVDPEIFNDDSLYEAVLRDELQNLLGDLTITDEDIEALKEDLIEKVLGAQHRAHDEIAGQSYKQNLRGTIAKMLPDQQNLSKEEQATMETLKDQLADAFIDLHYSGSNENLREQLKKKISDEIDQFCKNYLDKHPDSSFNSQKLNNDLYTALNNVPLPTGDSIKYEVEQARIREEINDWLRELPLEPQNPTELSNRNKLVYVLARKLFDIEVDADDTEEVPLMMKEIEKFLNKIPLKPEEDNNTLAQKLVDKLKASEASRKFDASANVTIDASGNVSGHGSGVEVPMCPHYKSLLDKQKASKCGRPCKVQSKSFPPCTLSAEDIIHLERIKQRTCLTPKCVTTLLKNHKRNSGVGPRSMEAGSQTQLRPESFGTDKPEQSSNCPASDEKTPRPCPGVPVGSKYLPCSQAMKPESIGAGKQQGPVCPASLCPAANDRTPRPYPGISRPGHQMKRHTISSSNIQSDCRGDVQPHIIIKEYYWAPSETDLQDSNLQKPDSRRDQSGPTCKETGTSPSTEFSPAPCHRPSSSTNQQRNTSSERLPSEHVVTCDKQRQLATGRCPHWDAQKTCQDRSSHRSIPCPRSPSPFGLTRQSTPTNSSGFSKDNCSRMSKRGLQEQIPCTSSRSSRKECVIELGSLDNLRNPRPKKRDGNNSDRSYTKNDRFWKEPMRRVTLDEGIDEPFVLQREHREEKIRCKCKEKMVPNSGRARSRRQSFSYCNEDDHFSKNLKGCSKCCGLHCPYPSYLYFRQ